jgi:predicted permease
VTTELRHAVKALRRAPGTSAAAILVLALGIGANAAIFSLLSTILLRPLPGIARQGELVNVHGTQPGGDDFGGFSYPDYLDYRERSRALEGLAAFNGRGMTFGAREQAGLVAAQLVSGNYFELLGVRAHLGRVILPDDDRAPGASPVAVVSHGFWQARLGGDPGVVGRTVRLNGFPFTVVGVATEGFTGHFVGFAMDVWVPLSMAAQAAPDETLDGRDSSWLELIGRLGPGVPLGSAQADLMRVAASLATEHPATHAGRGVNLQPTSGVDDDLRGPVAAFLAVLQGVAALVLLAASANVAGLLLARALARRRDAAIRLALGSGPWALVRQHLAETTLLFSAGGLGGLLLARWAAALLVSFQPRFAIPLRFDLQLDARVVLFAGLIALAAALVVALVPARVAMRAELVGSLKGLGAPERTRLRGALVIGQVALSLALLAGAGLFLRALQRARALDPGFETQHVQIASLNVSLLARGESQGRAFYASLLERARALPGVRSATLARRTPLSLGSLGTRIEVPGQPSADGRGYTVDFNAITPGYFETLGIPIVAGRALQPSDAPGSARVAVVSQALARRFWPDQEPLGQTIARGGDQLTIVGVAADSAVRRLGEEPRSQVYLPFDQSYAPGMTLLVRSEGPSAQLAAALRRELWALEPDLPILLEMPLHEYVGRSLAPQRMAGAVTGALGLLGIALAALGLYGVVAQLVAQRTREVGVRIALGAEAGAVVRLFVRDGMRLALAGSGAGLALAWGLGRLAHAFLPGVSPADAWALAGAGGFVASMAFAASWLPARRAARVDPVVALRSE